MKFSIAAASLVLMSSGVVNSLSTPTSKTSRTQRIMEGIVPEGQTGGAGGSSTYDAFLRAEENWTRLKQSQAIIDDLDDKILSSSGGTTPKPFVTNDGATGSTACWEKLRSQKGTNDFDVVVCGGTLGIFFATSLALQGHSVCVVEAGMLQGRQQEWNISMDEMEELKELGVLNQDDIDAVVTTEFPGCRSGFKNKEVTPTVGGYFDNHVGYECVTPDVLNLGVSPKLLLERVKQRFLSLDGTTTVLKEQTRLQGIVVSDSLGAAIDLGNDNDHEPITARLVLDCMGNASPISRQQRFGMKPDGVCAVVGSCASGYDATDNKIGDIIYTNTEVQDKGENGQYQYFWEAFPVGIGRNGIEETNVKTTYLFTYLDANEKRVSLETLMDDYFDLLPYYQPSITNAEEDLDFKRVLFAYFPTYRDSPLQPKWSRVLAVGDASGIQSPLSFGGFGALTRHLDRITGAVSDALNENILHKDDLGKINAYTPNLSAAWMFQKAMSVKIGSSVDSKFVNRLLATNFQEMDKMGPRTIKPFLQDVVRFDGLLSSLAGSFVADPTFMPEIVAHVGIPNLVDWLGHVSMMGLYTVLDATVTPVATPFVETMKNPRNKFHWKRQMEAWKFGSGRDYVLPPDDEE